MNGWRKDIAAISEAFGNPDPNINNWRENVRYIADAQGQFGNSWRENMKLIAQNYGVTSSGWRNNLRGVAYILGKEKAEGWRADILFIRKYYKVNPPAPPTILFFLDELPRQANTRYVWQSNRIWGKDKTWMR